MKRIVILIVLTLVQCQPRPANSNEPAQSPIERFRMRVTPAGERCEVLLIESELVLDANMVESIHYGLGEHDIDRGGIYGAYRDRNLRGVVYKDASGATWTYGNVTTENAHTLAPCK